MDTSKKSLHLILPGGGVKGCFQAGFLYQLFTKYQDHFTIERIDSTSVGALNGYTLCVNKLEELKKMWYDINDIDDIFEKGIKIPYIDTLYGTYNTIFNFGFYNSYSLCNKLKENYEESDLFSKFHCVVCDIENNEHKYINGTDEKIIKYVVASASPWLVVPPQEIDGKFYLDGGLVETYPIKYIEETKADYKIILGIDKTHLENSDYKAKNVVEYIGRLVDICRYNSENMYHVRKMVKEDTEQKNIIKINNPVSTDYLNFDKNIIREGFDKGIIEADKFAEEYLLS